MMKGVVLSAALLLLLRLCEIPAAGSWEAGACPSVYGSHDFHCSAEQAAGDQTSIRLVVMNSVTPAPNKTYSTYTVCRGILIGAMKRLQQDSSGNFTFTYTENQDYGPYLQSVNGLPGSFGNRTYWQLLVKHKSCGAIKSDVGIGCYIPESDDEIILNYTTY